MRLHRIWTVVALAAVALSTAPLDAQRPRDSRSEEDRARLEERIRAHVGEIIRHRLGLSEAEEERLSEVAREFERRRRVIMSRQREARERAKALLEEGEGNDSEAAAVLDRIVALQAEEAELFREEQARLREMLTATQVLEFYRIRIELGRRIRELRQGGHGDEAWGRGPNRDEDGRRSPRDGGRPGAG
ncbi:MAG: hypothetical protein U5R14_08910 [Gemmatimonadota bacterium]|nr:hypothetical protein [Gemmatimonadota bacterium]